MGNTTFNPYVLRIGKFIYSMSDKNENNEYVVVKSVIQKSKIILKNKEDKRLLVLEARAIEANSLKEVRKIIRSGRYEKYKKLNTESFNNQK